MTAVASFSWLAQRKSCYDIVDPWHCCKTLSLPLHLHLPSLSVLLLLPLSPCIGHVSHRLSLSLAVSLYMMYQLSCFPKTYPQALISLCSQHLSPSSHRLCISLSSTLCLLVASYRHLVHQSFNFLGMSQHICFGLMPSAAPR